MIVEICANSFESAQIAQNVCADRIELCRDLSIGGLTPLRSTIEKVLKELTIPVHVLIRPRGGDFCYSDAEFADMMNDIAYCKQLGCAGIVSGVLTAEGKINTTATKKLMVASEGMEFTFHRAFDECVNWQDGFDFLLSAGVSRLLSSGRQASAIDGLELLTSLNIQTKGKLQIMPGGGIHSQNVKAFKNAGFQMIHFSATKKAESSEDKGLFQVETIGHSNQQEIEKIIHLLS